MLTRVLRRMGSAPLVFAILNLSPRLDPQTLRQSSYRTRDDSLT